MRQIFWTAKSIQVLGKTDSRVLEMFHRVFDELATTLSFILAEANLALTVRSSGRKKNAGSISGALDTSFASKMLLLFYALNFVN